MKSRYCVVACLGLLAVCVPDILPENRFTALAQHCSSVDETIQEVSTLFRKDFEDALREGNRAQMSSLVLEFNEHVDRAFLCSESVLNTVIEKVCAVADKESCEERQALLKKLLDLGNRQKEFLESRHKDLDARGLVNNPELLEIFLDGFILSQDFLALHDSEYGKVIKFLELREENLLKRAISLAEIIIKWMRENTQSAVMIAVFISLLRKYFKKAKNN